MHTYTGHRILKTLIRCHFSPEANTGRQYVYSGSADGRVFIWTVEGELVKKLNVANAFKKPTPPQQQEQNAEDQWESEDGEAFRSVREQLWRARARAFSQHRRHVQTVWTLDFWLFSCS